MATPQPIQAEQKSHPAEGKAAKEMLSTEPVKRRTRKRKGMTATRGRVGSEQGAAAAAGATETRPPAGKASHRTEDWRGLDGDGSNKDGQVNELQRKFRKSI